MSEEEDQSESWSDGILGRHENYSFRSDDMTPKIDKSACIGCGTCISTCPDVFEMGTDNKSKIKKGADCQKAGCCQAAADACPANAIKL